MDKYHRLDGGETTLILCAAANETPYVVYWGERLAPGSDAATIEALNLRFGARSCEDKFVHASLTLEPGLGSMAPHGLAAHRDGLDWATRLNVESVRAEKASIYLSCADPQSCVSVSYVIELDELTGVMTLSSTLQNNGQNDLRVDQFVSGVLPVPRKMTDIISFTGRWSAEFSRERLSRFSGAVVRENLRGRTSHDSFPGFYICEDATNEHSGAAYGFHLAWSGNHRLRIDTLKDGQTLVSMGALLLPGEMKLAPGESMQAPDMVACFATEGLSSLSRHFHDHVRDNVIPQNVLERPRPVHLNTWEAVYFNQTTENLKELANKAAEVGVERFVLDDGWFGARRNDTAGLGDWDISKDVFPEGLGPLIDHVTSLGMEMGIWFEPEMVNPDSDLYRAHPDWALGVSGIEQIPFRNQLVLDVAREEVADYLFQKIDNVLSNNRIGYIKWDMNRDLHLPGGSDGKAAAYKQVRAVWTLIDRIKAKHPGVEIETCASGGGRADYGILARTDRVWTSDSNDALDRQNIQAGASYFLPLAVMGAHIGPDEGHQTKRKLSMAMRAGTAIFGHMGLELNLLEETQEDLAQIRDAISLYKQHRNLIHTGDLYRKTTEVTTNAFGIVAKDKSEALFSFAYLAGQTETHPEQVYFSGIDPHESYSVRLIWPGDWSEYRKPSSVEALSLLEKGAVISGDILAKNGIQLPHAFPETVLIFHLVRAV